MNNQSQPTDKVSKLAVPTVSRVCDDQTLVELVYDATKRTTGLAVSRFGGLWNIEQEVRIETGETLVPYSPKNNLIANECVLLPSVPSEYFTKEELITDIQAFLHRHVDLSRLFEKIAAYYILLTWVHDAFGEVPYLRLRGEYGTGKTRGLMAIGSLCYKAFSASGASTTSPIFHTLHAFGGTLLFDEADLPYSDARADIVKILNNGTVQGMPVLRTVVIALAAGRDIDTPIYDRNTIRDCFKASGARTRREVALSIAERIEVFRHRLPRERRRWDSEDVRQSLFDAVALVLTHFAVTGRRTDHPPA